MKKLFEKQMLFQKKVFENFGYNGRTLNDVELPNDVPDVSSYHMLALMEEVGELVKSDKRWKNYRNTKFDKENKLEELCDCFITLMNIAMFSGITSDKLYDAIMAKIDENTSRCFR